MANFRLKELKDTTKHESNIRRYVMANMHKKQKGHCFVAVLTVLVSVAVLFFIVNIMNPSNTLKRSGSEPLLYHVFEEVRGKGVAYSEFFSQFDGKDTRQLTYYKPVLLNEFLVANDVAMPSLPEPFSSDSGEVIAVQDAMYTEFQLHFEHEESFLNISLTKNFMDPFASKELQNIERDTMGDKITKLELIGDTPLYFIKRPTELISDRYTHYQFDSEKNRIHLNLLTANEFYTYYDGMIYHIGYAGAVDEEEMIAFVRDFVIHNTIQQLDFEKKYGKWGSSLPIKLISVSIFVLCFIIVIAYIFRRESKKVRLLTYGLSLLFVITPLVSWVISMVYALYEQDGFAGIGMLILLLPIGIMLSLILIIYSIVLFIKDIKNKIKSI